MGYPRDDSAYALEISSNNIEHACTFLINNPNPRSSMNGMGGFSIGGGRVDRGILGNRAETILLEANRLQS
jgi:hypothetical protein